MTLRTSALYSTVSARKADSERSLSTSTLASIRLVVRSASKRAAGTLRTTSPYICRKRRYASHAKRGLPLCAASATTVSSFKPRLSTVSIIPGIETAAPLRTETSSGLDGIAEPLARCLLEPREMIADFLAKRARDATGGEILHARAARDREPWRNGHAEVRHLGQVGALGSQDALHLTRPVSATLTEEVDERRHGGGNQRVTGATCKRRFQTDFPGRCRATACRDQRLSQITTNCTVLRWSAVKLRLVKAFNAGAAESQGTQGIPLRPRRPPRSKSFLWLSECCRNYLAATRWNLSATVGGAVGYSPEKQA